MLRKRAWTVIAGASLAWMAAVACGSTDDFQGGGRREDLPGADAGDLIEPIEASPVADSAGDDGDVSTDAVADDADAGPDGFVEADSRAADTGVADVAVDRPVDTGVADASNSD